MQLALDMSINLIFMVGFNSDMEQMKERFAKLLLGEDMSGGGKGVSSALALSNAFTNLAGRLISCFLSPSAKTLFFFPILLDLRWTNICHTPSIFVL